MAVTEFLDAVDKKKKEEEAATAAAPVSEEVAPAAPSVFGYTPTRDDLLYTVEVLNTFVFKKQSSDHSAVLLKIESQQGKLGHDRISLRNDLMEEEEIQLKVLEAYKSAWRTQGSPEKKWRAGNNKAYEILLNETRRRQKIEHKEIKYKLAILDVFSKRHARGGATEASVKAEQRLQDQLYELRHPEKPPNNVKGHLGACVVELNKWVAPSKSLNGCCLRFAASESNNSCALVLLEVQH